MRCRAAVLGERQRREHLRHAVATALLAGGDGDALPVRALLHGALAGDAAASSAPRCTGCSAATPSSVAFCTVKSIFSLEDTPCTSVTRKRRLALERPVREHVHAHAQALDGGDAPGILAAAPVEQRDFLARAQPQHVHRVVRGVVGQQRDAARAQIFLGMEARNRAPAFRAYSDSA